MRLRNLLRFIGGALAVSLVAMAITVAVAWFVLDWRTGDEISEALFWATFIVCGFLFMAAPKHVDASSIADARSRWANYQFRHFGYLLLVGVFMMGTAILVEIVF